MKNVRFWNTGMMDQFLSKDGYLVLLDFVWGSCRIIKRLETK